MALERLIALEREMFKTMNSRLPVRDLWQRRCGPRSPNRVKGQPVFVDPSGRRRRRMRTIGVIVGWTAALVLTVLIGEILVGYLDQAGSIPIGQGHAPSIGIL